MYTLNPKKPSQKRKIDQIDTSRLQDPKIKEDLKRHINDNLRLLSTKTQNTHVEDKWQDLKEAIIKPAQSLLTREKQKKGQEWITEKILGLMEERRHCKTKCRQKYNEVHKQIRNEIRTAKETFYERKCEEIEELQLKHDTFNLHKKIKELAGIQKRKHPNLLCNANGEIITDLQQKLMTWKNYVEELFDDERQEHNIDSIQGDEGPEITKEEILYAIKTMKNGKSPGPDGLTSELLKLVEGDSVNTLVDLFNCIYKTGEIPKEWLVSTFCHHAKKGKRKTVHNKPNGTHIKSIPQSDSHKNSQKTRCGYW